MDLKRYALNRIRKYNFINNHTKSIYNRYLKLFNKSEVNICYNAFIPKQYDPAKKNILLALESPAVIEYMKWLSPDMKFEAEISFGNYYSLENYLCCRDLYVNSDNFINVKTGTIFRNKPNEISIVCSNKKHLEGHRFRHELIGKFGNLIDVFGSGYNKFGDITKAYTDYKFQVVVENGKHPEYVSEKLFDCIKTQTLPIYRGGEQGLRKMGFNMDGFIFFNTSEELSQILSQLNTSHYQDKYSAITENLNRLIEIRNEKKMNLYLNTTMLRYMHTQQSYLGIGFNQLNLFPDKMLNDNL
jgi:hypothetical protein